MICTKIQSTVNVMNNKQRTISVFIHVAEDDKTFTYNISENSNILKSLTNFVIFLMVQINLKIEHDFCLINVINEDDTEQLTSDVEFLKCLQSIKESEVLGLQLLLFGAHLNDNINSIETSSDLECMEKLFNINKAITKTPHPNIKLNPLYFANKSEQIIFRKPITLKTIAAVQDIGLQYEDQDIEITGLKSNEMPEETNTGNNTNHVKTTVQTTVQRTHLTVQSTTCGPNNLMINLEESDNNSFTNKKLQIQSTEYGRNNLCIHIDEKTSTDVDIVTRTVPDEDQSSESVKSSKEGNKSIQYQNMLPKVIEKRTNLLNHKFDEACECCHIDITNCDIDYEGNRPIKRRLSDDSIQLRSPSSDVPYLTYAKNSSNQKTHKQAKGGRRKFSGIRFQQRKRNQQTLPLMYSGWLGDIALAAISPPFGYYVWIYLYNEVHK